MSEALGGVYRERARFVALLTRVFPSTCCADEPGWCLVYVESPVGQLSWHIAASDMDLFDHVPSGVVVWDGHSSEEKYARLDRLAGFLAEACGVRGHV